jgi:undecaprenyl-diphosphatase
MFSDPLAAIGRLDAAAFQWLRTHHTPFADVVMAGVSDIARGGAVWIALAVLVGFLYRSRWPAVVHVLLAIALTFLVTDHIAKPFFNRSRPFESDTSSRVYGYKPATRSFPSGHAASAIAGAYALARLAPEARSVLWALAFLVVCSRVYLGVHYPADVLAGALLGWGTGAFVVGGTEWRLGRTDDRAESRDV